MEFVGKDFKKGNETKVKSFYTLTKAIKKVAPNECDLEVNLNIFKTKSGIA